MNAKDGVDFMTIHCGINRLTAKRFKEAKALNEYCITRWFNYICMDGNDRQ